MSKLSYSAPSARANQYILLKYKFMTPGNGEAELKLKLSPMSPARHEELVKKLATEWMLPLMDKLGKVSGLSADKITALMHGTLNENDSDVKGAMENTFMIQGVFTEMQEAKYTMVKEYIKIMADGGLDMDEEDSLDELKLHAFSQVRRTEARAALDDYVEKQKKADESGLKKDKTSAEKAFDHAESLEEDEAQTLFEAFMNIQEDYSAKHFEDMSDTSPPDADNVDEASAAEESKTAKKS